MDNVKSLVVRAESLLDRLENFLLPKEQVIDWDATAWRWVAGNEKGVLQAVENPDEVQLNDVQFVEKQKQALVRNTRQFLQGLTANNVLLTGARGTGKSSLVKGLLTAFSADGLRLIEVEKHDLVHLPNIVHIIRNRPEKFIIYCDDLSFEANDVAYKALKVVLDGSIASTSDNVLVYATSNRKNLIPELMADNKTTEYIGNEVRPGDTVEEKSALVERFGLWLSFHAFDQEKYLAIAAHWLNTFGIGFDEAAKKAALDFTYARGARSGRVRLPICKRLCGESATT